MARLIHVFSVLAGQFMFPGSAIHQLEEQLNVQEHILIIQSAPFLMILIYLLLICSFIIVNYLLLSYAAFCKTEI